MANFPYSFLLPRNIRQMFCFFLRYSITRAKLNVNSVTGLVRYIHYKNDIFYLSIVICNGSTTKQGCNGSRKKGRYTRHVL